MEIELGVTDNGVGLPEDLDPGNADTVGLSLASGLALKQLGGAFEVERGIGTRFTIRFAPRSVKPAGS
jgi:two-component sensor histidine kinase